MKVSGSESAAFQMTQSVFSDDGNSYEEMLRAQRLQTPPSVSDDTQHRMETLIHRQFISREQFQLQPEFVPQPFVSTRHKVDVRGGFLWLSSHKEDYENATKNLLGG